MTLATLITSLRILANDGPDSKTIFDEQLGSDPAMPVDGVNVNFKVKSIPLADVAQSGTNNAIYMWVSIVGTGAVFRSQLRTLFKVIDPVNGIIQFIAAPNPGSAQGQGVYVSYNYYWFSDAKYTEFLNEATNNLLLDAATDPTTVNTGLVPALLQYALASFFKARASQFMERYTSSGGQAGQSVDAVSKIYLTAAGQAEKRADTIRAAYYQRQGQRDAPAFTDTIPLKMDPITPKR